jgi:hypothetical protein
LPGPLTLQLKKKKKKQQSQKQLEGIEKRPQGHTCVRVVVRIPVFYYRSLSLSFFSILPELSYSVMCLQGE